jgi:hypothetical protein
MKLTIKHLKNLVELFQNKKLMKISDIYKYIIYDLYLLFVSFYL